jgi:hypothetical protein
MQIPGSSREDLGGFVVTGEACARSMKEKRRKDLGQDLEPEARITSEREAKDFRDPFVLACRERWLSNKTGRQE